MTDWLDTTGDDVREAELVPNPHIDTLPLPTTKAELDAIKKAERARRARGIGFTAPMHDAGGGRVNP